MSRARRERLDAEVVRRGLVDSRSAARRAIEEGRVRVSGLPDPRPASLVGRDVAIDLEGRQRFVSRGGDKLDGALEELDVSVKDRDWVDVGASTGGFTDRLLQGGARRVVAVDVGYGQFAWSLRNDDRVILLERTNVRFLDREAMPFEPDGVVADLSFISLRLVVEALAKIASVDADHLYLVKPQFEVGRDRVGSKGVVRDPAAWRDALVGVVDAALDQGLGLVEAVPSRVPGPAGNREFFVHLNRAGDGDDAILDRVVEEVAATWSE